MGNSNLENEIIKQVDALIQCALSVSLKDEASRREQIEEGIQRVQKMGSLLLEVLEGREQHFQALLEQLVAQRLPDRRVLQSFNSFSQDINEIIRLGTEAFFQLKENSAIQGEITADAEAEVFLPEEEGPELTDNYIEAVRENKGMELIEDFIDRPGETVEPACSTVVAERDYQEKELPVETESEYTEAGAISTDDSVTYQEPSECETPAAGEKYASLHLALLQAFPGESIIYNFKTPYGYLAFYLPGLKTGFKLAGSRYDWREEYFCRQEGIRVRSINIEDLHNPVLLARRLRRETYWQHRS